MKMKRAEQCVGSCCAGACGGLHVGHPGGDGGAGGQGRPQGSPPDVHARGLSPNNISEYLFPRMATPPLNRPFQSVLPRDGLGGGRAGHHGDGAHGDRRHQGLHHRWLIAPGRVLAYHTIPHHMYRIYPVPYHTIDYTSEYENF